MIGTSLSLELPKLRPHPSLCWFAANVEERDTAPTEAWPHSRQATVNVNAQSGGLVHGPVIILKSHT
jgi:hypothetical protein